MARSLWFVVGIAALAAAVVGIALPLLPTTPLLLVAAFAFARSSHRLHTWLLDHSVFGPLIEDWRAHGSIRPRAKAAAVASMVGVLLLSLLLGAASWILAVQALVLFAVGAFVLSRPSGPRAET